jgi:hypothetical protein
MVKGFEFMIINCNLSKNEQGPEHKFEQICRDQDLPFTFKVAFSSLVAIKGFPPSIQLGTLKPVSKPKDKQSEKIEVFKVTFKIVVTVATCQKKQCHDVAIGNFNENLTVFKKGI